MNLIVVDKCTNYCRYCFASNEMAKSSAKSVLREEDFDYLLGFIEKSGPNFELNIIGGEPFLYPLLPSLLDRLLALNNVSSVCIFTGGIASRQAVKAVSDLDPERLTTLFNMNERKDYKTQREYDTVLRNFDLLLSHGITSRFGYNIYEENFGYEEILDLCDQFGIDILRWTVAFPELVPNAHTTTLAPHQYARVATRVVQFLEAAYQRGIKAGLDCPVPKCFFDNAQLGRIALTQPLTLAAIRSCGPVIDIAPNLDVFRCYALSDLKRTNLTAFRSYEEVVAFFTQQIDDIYAIPTVFPSCPTCEFALDRTCFGGCMAHNPASIGAGDSASELVNSMFGSLNDGDFEEAGRIYQRNPRLLSSKPLACYLMSFVEELRGNIAGAVRFARRSVVRSTSPANAKRFGARLAELQDGTNSLPRLRWRENVTMAP